MICMKNYFNSSVELRRAFVEGQLSSLEIAKEFLRRTKEQEPVVGAFIQLDEESILKQAESVDAKRARGEKLGLLAAVPVAIKDNIAVKGMGLTCGSKFLEKYICPYNATVSRLIQEEDGILFGKTNLDEFAMGSSCENSALKRTVNPWNKELTPGGSSGGSAAAVAAGMAPLSLGSDTGGSIRLPASFCGVTGFKPTYGRVSRFGLVAFGSSLDQIGPFARSAQEVDQIMNVLGRHCSHDATSLMVDPYRSYEVKNEKKLRIGVPWQFFEGLGPESLALFQESVKLFESEYGATVHTVDLSLLRYSIAVYYILATAEVSTNLARFDGIRYGKRSIDADSLEEVYEMSREEGFGQEVKRRILLGTFVLSSGYQDAFYRKAQSVRRLIRDQFAQAFQSVDCIMMPVSTGGAFPFGSKKDPVSMYLEDIYTIGPNLAGLPAISLPAGFLKNGAPVGVQLIAPQKQDPFLVHQGIAFQQKSQFHTVLPPYNSIQ